MPLDAFVRFHARPGAEEAIADVMREACADVRAEPGCVFIGYFRSAGDPALLHIHSRWRDEGAFERHAELPHTVQFLARVQPLLDHPLIEWLGEVDEESKRDLMAGNLSMVALFGRSSSWINCQRSCRSTELRS